MQVHGAIGRSCQLRTEYSVGNAKFQNDGSDSPRGTSPHLAGTQVRRYAGTKGDFEEKNAVLVQKSHNGYGGGPGGQLLPVVEAEIDDKRLFFSNAVSDRSRCVDLGLAFARSGTKKLFKIQLMGNKNNGQKSFGERSRSIDPSAS
jgi:hypothetical protein